MTLTDIEILIFAAERGICVIGKSLHCELVAELRKSKRKDLLDRLLSITPYEKKGGEQ